MNRIIRQVFGTTRPRDIFGNLLTFDQMAVRPAIHIVYWAGLGLFVIAGFGMAGVSIGSAAHDHDVMAWFLATGVTVISWLGLLIGVLAWRAFCRFYMAVMSIAEDLHYLRQFQERLSPESPVAQPRPQPVVTPPPAAPEPFAAAMASAEPPEVAPAEAASPMEDGEAPKETGNILEDPFFRPRFGKKE